MKKQLLFTLAATVALGGVLRADDGKPTAALAGASATAATQPQATPVAKLDRPGSLKIGNRFLDEGKYAQAAAYYEGIGVQVKDNGTKKREPYRLNNLALAQLNLQDYSDAIANASKAIELKPDLEAAYNNLAAAYSASGKRDQAVDTLTKGIAAVKAAGGDTSKLEGNLKGIQDAIEASKPKAVREADAKAAADAAAAKLSDTAKAAADAAQPATGAEK